MKPYELIAYIESGALDETLTSLYGDTKLARQKSRYITALKAFSALYGECENTRIFSVPGRSEISGNHTDHNCGCVLAASIDLDMLAIAAPTSDGVIRMKSEGFDADTVVIHEREATKAHRYSSESLIAGVCDGMLKNGYTVGGFVSYTTNDVFKGSGLSSSAAFEVMIGNILRTLYDNAISDIEDCLDKIEGASLTTIDRQIYCQPNVECVRVQQVPLAYQEIIAPEVMRRGSRK